VATGLPDAVTVEVEFTDGVWTDVTADVVSGVEITRGRASAVDSSQPGMCTFTLDNASGGYTPDNPLSTLYPNWVEGKRVRVVVEYDSTEFVRFLGWVVQIEPGFPMDVSSALVNVVAADAMGRLERRRLRSILREYLVGSTAPGGDSMADLLYDYFPLTDADGSRAATSAFPSGAIGTLTLHGSASWGTAAVSPTLGADVVTLPAGSRLTGSSSRPVSGQSINQAGMWFTCPEDAYGVLFTIRGHGGVLTVSVQSGGQLGLYRVATDGTVLTNAAYGPLVNDGTPHFVGYVEASYPAFIYERSLHVDGVSVYEDFGDSPYLYAGSVTIGPPTAGEIGVGHFFMAKSSNDADNLIVKTEVYNLTLPSALSLTQDELLDHVSTWTGTTVDGTTGSTRPVTPLPTEGMSALDLAQLVANNETGRMWHDYEADAVYVESVSDAYPDTVALTLDVEDDAVGEVVMARDASLLVKSVTARNGATDTTAEDADADTDATAGVDACVSDLNQLWEKASARIALGKYQRLRPAQIRVDLMTATNDLYADAFALRPGLRVRVANLPSAHFGVTYMDGYVEGWQEFIGVEGYAFTLDLSPADAPGVARFDTARFAFGDGVANLNGAIDADDTSISIEWTGSSVLSTDSGDYPLDLNINGERVTVSTAPGAGTSPRTLTVTRGVAPTIARAHADGEPVEVWDAGRFTTYAIDDGGSG
jgi:hypothetical protein